MTSRRSSRRYTPPSPRTSGGARVPSGPRRSQKSVSLTDNDTIRPATREETLPVVMGALALACITLITCLNKGYLLLYGDAVAHLGIARRLLDARYPGLAQLGGVWLPLPHILMLPFIGNMEWWQNGMAGAWPSLAAFLLAVIGFYRLARRLMPPLWALASTAFFALNPNLLYLATTAMTEPLFLAIILWLVLLTSECLDALAPSDGSPANLPRIRSRLFWIGLLIVAAVYTRYDGWILAALVWCVLAFALLRHRQHLPQLRSAFALFTAITIAAPLGWFAYNQHFFGDFLDFLRGPYSASAIERKTSPPGSKHYRGWHNPGWALLFYTRTAQVDTTAWEIGFITLPLAFIGAWRVCLSWFHPQHRANALTDTASPTTTQTAPSRTLAISNSPRADRHIAPEAHQFHPSTTDLNLEPASLLLWFPLPFYVYSIAWGSVPIFIPQLYPHSFYNARYGMEMLPAIALFAFLALAWTERRLRTTHPLAARLLPPVCFALAVVNAVVMMATTPLVLKEGIVNSVTRVAFERSLAHQLESFPAGSAILMSTNDHIGAIQQAGIPLRSMLSETDRDSFQSALAAPGQKADYIIAIAKDPVDAAVRAHPAGLTELTVLCTTGQPCARVYKSTHAPDPKPLPLNTP